MVTPKIRKQQTERQEGEKADPSGTGSGTSDPGKAEQSLNDRSRAKTIADFSILFFFG